MNIAKQGVIDLNLLLQSSPSLLISLVGLLTTGKLLETGIQNLEIQDIPLLLQSNCILNFKGNIELIYALYLSSMRRESYRKYLRYAFDNACLVLLQSIIIGITVGIIGISKAVFSGLLDIKLLTNIMAISLCTCTVTTLLFIVALIVTIEISENCSIDLDNVLLPCVSSISDFISVKFILFFAIYFKSASTSTVYYFLVSSMILIPFCVFFTCISKQRVPMQSIEVLGFTYILSTSCGYVLDHLSNRFTFLASAFPVYSGLAVSISFIHLHKIFLILNNNSESNPKSSYITLLLMSLIFISLYTMLSLFISETKSLLFYSLFIALFVIQVCILLKLIELMISKLNDSEQDIGVVSLPVLTAVGDVVSTIFLVIIAYITIKNLN